MQWFGLSTAFLATISWALCTFPFTRAGRVMSVPTMNLLRLVAGAAMVLLFTLLFEWSNVTAIFSPVYLDGWLWLGLSGIVALCIGDFLSYRMFTILSPRYGAVFATMSPASALLFGWILLNESVNVVGLVGMTITIGGVLGMSFSRQERKSIPNHGQGSVLRGMLYGSIGALCNGIGTVCSKQGFLLQLERGYPLQPLTGTFIRIFVSALIVTTILFITGKLRKQARNLVAQPPAILRIAMLAILLGPLLAVSFSMMAIQTINVAVAQTIYALVPVVALLVAHFFYKEKITSHALVGVLLAILGVSVLIWRNDISMLITGT